MYLPTAFAEFDPAKLHDAIERHSFGLLVTQAGGRPFATHLPFLLERTAGPHGTLVGHLARANPQWHDLAGQTALAVFSGPHAYVSPTWYEAEQVVPTWNYVAVHASGRFQAVEDADALAELLQRMVGVYEQRLPRPWSFDAADPAVRRRLAQVVGFRIPIDRIEGKWKLNQNHPAERRRNVVRALRERGGEDARAVADLMAGMLPPAGAADRTGPEN